MNIDWGGLAAAFRISRLGSFQPSWRSSRAAPRFLCLIILSQASKKG